MLFLLTLSAIASMDCNERASSLTRPVVCINSFCEYALYAAVANCPNAIAANSHTPPLTHPQLPPHNSHHTHTGHPSISRYSHPCLFDSSCPTLVPNASWCDTQTLHSTSHFCTKLEISKTTCFESYLFMFFNEYHYPERVGSQVEFLNNKTNAHSN